MADLFALQRIHGDVLFRNDDYVAAEKAKAIGRLLEHLRRELRELALPLVDAWNIPVRATIPLPCPAGQHSSCAWNTPVRAAMGCRAALLTCMQAGASRVESSARVQDHILRAPIGLSTHGMQPYESYLRAGGWD